MLEKFKDSLEKRTMYQVDSVYKITKSEMDDMDVASSRYPSFETRDKAKQYCIDCLKKDISQLESRISSYEKSIKDCKADLKKKNTLLKKYDKSEE
jgi:septal ring factor EnvC (AmiA/AmiB activator)